MLQQFAQACQGLHVSAAHAAGMLGRLIFSGPCRCPSCRRCLATVAAAATCLLAPLSTLTPRPLPPAAAPLPQNPATRAQAEQALLEFRRTAGLEAAVAVLQQATDEAVQFQVWSGGSSSILFHCHLQALA